jgi:signal peptide peptidase SppA
MTETHLPRIAGRIFNTPLMIHPAKLEADSSFVLGYETIACQIESALSDADVAGIVLNIDSPGGELSGAFDLAQKIFESRGVKPIRAVASDLAASAAYLLASAADSIAITETGYAGSIGVVMRHVDMSQALENDGFRVTSIFAGAKKIDGNPFGPMPKKVMAEFQHEIDSLYDLFVERVAQYRGIDAEHVRSTEAGLFRGQKAVDAGLADLVSNPDAVLAGFGDLNSQQSLSSGGNSMTTKAITKAADKQDEKIDVSAQIETARAEGYKAGQEDERARITGILNHAEAEGREAQAKALALETDLNIEQAGKVLAVSPVATLETEEPSNPFTEHMNALGNPAIGADESEPNEMQESQAIQMGWANAFGHRPN